MNSIYRIHYLKMIGMNQIVCVTCTIIISLSLAANEHEYFPGLRRTKPSDAKEAPEFLRTINELIEEQARRRFLEHLQRFHLNRNILLRTDAEEVSRPAFTYQLAMNDHIELDKPIEFAVNPGDPRFFDHTLSADPIRHNNEPDEKPVRELMNELNVNLPPSPQDVKPKHPIYNQQQISNNKMRYNEYKLDENTLPQSGNGVIQKPVKMDGVMTMYIVALIGGISAAVTVGLISVGIGWYTLQRKAKAAADIDYPAYGVTGPNKDSSPSGDKRLAHSAHMYHYQHQKQQIIAMENHNAVDKNKMHSEAESEDDNEEGDYTVYECPGLAPTGEMEVKNPLFLDDAHGGALAATTTITDVSVPTIGNNQL
ncbi:uncharacterized protein LOC129780341 [Toxorhynchites rutilus septentrionalis]|uniref:uncharacterized protein LOC129780341 n=1 Tax=Toxorhynchites rutilus septentrionalis TaxID=329112 RepID=UPI0024785609|nr:uncharacterized protein LOC129780341 [Toxorhynchites rutilus septentrionalis]